LHDRLANFHLVSQSAKAIYSQKKLHDLLTILFQCPPKIVGSLFFERSSEQSIHRDTPTFFTNPLNHYVGVWYALEDIDSQQGPLAYYGGSHKIAPDQKLRQQFDEAEAYNASVIEACEQAGLTLAEFYPQKGDMLIWHPQLAHGGMRCSGPGLTRYSMVMHWMSSRATIHPPKEFFSNGDRIAKDASRYRLLDGVEAIDHGAPQFFVNRREGNFDEF
jgi:ectoine hydroxylase-related dioxygenase (phytanoyl-CoA dioxygenase family)